VRGIKAKTRAKARKVGLWSKRGYARIDQRLLEAREEKRLIRMLSEHVGAPSGPQTVLIERTARSLLMVSMLERRLIERAELTDLGARQVVALSNSIRLNLQALGLAKPEQQAPALVEYLGAKGRAA
jgi:hypothetical protein